MKALWRCSSILLLFLITAMTYGQNTEDLTSALQRHTIHFSLGLEHQLTGEARELLKKELSKHQFVGLAELHRSAQLSYFTTGLIELLQEANYQHLALEMGTFQVNALSAMSKVGALAEGISRTNRQYGSRLLTISPLVFADRKEDAIFLEKALDSNMQLWGFDQEHLFSFEMQFDQLYERAAHKPPALTALYKKSKSQIHRWNKKQVLKPKFKMGCELMWNETMNDFLNAVAQDEESKKQVAAILNSWGIYCDSESGKGSNQKRANYMKAHLDSLISHCIDANPQPKVFLKFGSVHLTKGKSRFGVNDLGKYVNEIAAKNQSGFLNIRHLKRYLNGKDLIGKKGWKSSTNFMQQGLKDQWTLIDLRPIRAQLVAGKLVCSKSEAFEINSYDFILISPDDRQSKKNF